MIRRSRLLGWTLATAALVGLLLLGLLSGGSSVTGRRASRLPRERLAGPPVALTGLRTHSGEGVLTGGGRPAIITFWASWCVPCAREAPALERFSLSPAGRGRLVGVDWSDGLSEALSFIRRYSWTFSNLRDSEGTVGNDYHLTGLPTTFVLDASSHIRTVLRGPQNEDSLGRALAGVSHS
jgi:thiol-disulfide isomerase/thioredoxin